MRNYAGTCKSSCSYNLVYIFLIQLLPLKSSVFVVHFSNAFWYWNKTFPKVSSQNEIVPLFVIFHLPYSKYRGMKICFYLCRYQNQKFSLVSHSCDSCSTRVALVSFMYHSCCTRVTHVALVLHLCCNRVAPVSLVLHSCHSCCICVARVALVCSCLALVF